VGRPRDGAREAAILEAALVVLGEVGYDRLTIDAVAARAKASKATVYRRWSGKAALVVDALQTLTQSAVPAALPDEPYPCHWPSTGSLRGDLLAGVAAAVERMSTEEGRLIAAVITAQARDPELAAAMRAATYEEKCRSFRVLVDRAVARGELETSVGAEVLAEVLPAVLFSRLLVSGEPFDERFVLHVVDDIALPLLGARSTPHPT
jgi:AcrR family transcriptional regulator